MKCSCCGKKKRLLESFEQLNKDLAVCVDCSTLLYKLRDAKKDNNKEEFDLAYNKINAKVEKKATKEFIAWYKNFVEKEQKSRLDFGKH